MGLTELFIQPEFSSDAWYTLLARQVTSFQKQSHRAGDTSLPAQIVQELMASIQYTLALASGKTIDEAFASGQMVLSQLLARAKALWQLVDATAPGENAYLWSSLQGMKRYLETYDACHFAHRIPQQMDYLPLLPGEQSQIGVHWALDYLTRLWKENQILDAFSPESLEVLWASMPPDYWAAPQNVCEQPLCNAFGKALLRRPLNGLLLTPEELTAIQQLADRERVDGAVEALMEGMALPQEAANYARSALKGQLPRFWTAWQAGNLAGFFLGTEWT